MKVAYFGSSRFSVPPLKSVAGIVSCVVTRSAKPKGRGYGLEDNEVKRAAQDLGIPVIEIASFKDERMETLRAFRPDLYLVASFGLIIPRWVLELPVVGAVNVHPSLLPKYRGPSPMQWAFLNGDGETGITLIRMSERMDAGNVLYQEKVSIDPGEDAVSLSERLSARVGEILPSFLEGVERGGLPEGAVQAEEYATYTPIITKEMGKVDWTGSALEIERQIRAFAMWPVAYTYLDGLMLKIFRGKVVDGSVEGIPGTVNAVTRAGVTVCTGGGLVLMEEVQLENRKRVGSYSFAQGYRGLTGKVLL